MNEISTKLFSQPQTRSSAASFGVFVINLERAPQRRARMSKLLDEQDVAYEIVAAVDGLHLSQEDRQFWQGDPLRAKLNPGEIGCMLSHRMVWQRIVDEGLAGAVVLEDDLCIAQDFGEVVQSLAGSTLLARAKLVRLEADAQPVLLSRSNTSLTDAYRLHRLRRDRTLRAGAYALSHAQACKLVQHAPAMKHPVDAELFDGPRSSLPITRLAQLIPAPAKQAELYEGALQDAPFLVSSIANSGPRADHRTGRARSEEGFLLGLMRRTLRPIKSTLLRLYLAPTRWRHRIIAGP